PPTPLGSHSALRLLHSFPTRRSSDLALEKYTPLMFLIEQAASSKLALANVYERIANVSIDYAVMESAANDGRVVMGSMDVGWSRSEEHTSELQSLRHLVCRLLLEKKK